MISGTPNIGVKALIGSNLPFSGKVLINRQIEVHNAPQRADVGISILWLSVLVIIRDKCGILSPTNAIGPQ